MSINSDTVLELQYLLFFQYIYEICRLGGPYSEKSVAEALAGEGSIFQPEVTVFH